MRCFLVLGWAKLKFLQSAVVRDAIRPTESSLFGVGYRGGDNPYAFTFNCPHLSHRLPPAAVLPHHWRIRHYMTGS